MKAIKSYLCITFLFAFFTVQYVKAQLSDNAAYQTAIKKTVAKMDTASSVADLQQCRNSFERIAMKYTNEWLAVYYIAYTDVQIVYVEVGNEKNQLNLDDAKKQLEKLDKFTEADKSETNTLWGYYYMALVVMDPQTNGQKYTGDVIASFDKAKKLNPNNPRAIFWRAFYNEKLPSFMRSKMDYCDELAKAKELFAQEKKSWDKPYWGEKSLKNEQRKCNNK